MNLAVSRNVIVDLVLFDSGHPFGVNDPRGYSCRIMQGIKHDPEYMFKSEQW